MMKHLFAVAAAICVAGPLAAGELDKEFSSKPSKNTPAATAAKATTTVKAKASELDAEAPTQAYRGGGYRGGWGGGYRGGWGGGYRGGWGGGYRGGYAWGGGYRGGYWGGGYRGGYWGGYGRGYGWGGYGVGIGIGLGGYGWGGGYWGGYPYYGGYASYYYPSYAYSYYPSACSCW
jgi:hypothetical protein